MTLWPSADVRPGAQKIVSGLKDGPGERSILEQVLEPLQPPPGDDHRARWLDVFYALEVLAVDGRVPEVKPVFAQFVEAFPVQDPLEFVRWMQTRKPMVVIAFWRVFRALREAVEDDDGCA